MNTPALTPSFRKSIPVYHFGFGFGFGRRGRIPLKVPKCGDGGGAPTLPPVVTSISPARGPLVGGQSVTISGSYFTDATDVTIGGTSATDIVVVNSATITCTTPAGLAGDVSVEVTTPLGTNAPNTLYEYLEEPVLLSVTPNTGDTDGGTPVTLGGTGFLYATSVTFDGVAATDLVVVDDTEITCTTPAGSSGTASVIVTTPGGSNAANTDFTYVAGLPNVASVSPARGPLVGGQAVTITGSNFTDATDVEFDGVSATDIVVVSDTEITCTTPSGTAGTASVVVTTPDGSNGPNTAYEYLIVPVLDSVSPGAGATGGGTSVTLSGSGFLYATGVTFDGAAATSVVVVNDTTITCTTPAGSAGAASVIVTTPGGSNGANTEFTYVSAPSLISVSPSAGPTTGEQSVILSGTAFTDATGVTFDGIPATDVSVVNDTTIACTTPANSSGAASVIVTTPYGSNGANSAYTYGEVPTVTSVSPNNGSVDGEESVTITGTNFTGATGVTFEGAAATDVVVVNSTTITCTTPIGSAGPASVIVTNPYGTNDPNTAFLYLGVPQLDSVSPNTGGAAGGTNVTLTGLSFTGATGVTFDGVAATSVVVVDDETITCTTPAGSAGAASVIVTTPLGSNGANSEFTYVAAPVLDSVDPATGATAGGTAVTLYGSGFTGATGVTFDGAAATDVDVLDDTEITCTTPAGAAGTASVIVTTPYGSNGANTEFTYVAAPVLDSVDPAEGTTAGGEPVTLYGSNFTGATGVTFDGAAATDVVVVNDGEITCTTPAGSAGTASVIVTTPYGSNGANTEFTYEAPSTPVLTSVTPSSGTEAGGTPVTLVGTGFTDASSVTFHGFAATDVVVVSDTEITCVTPDIGGTGAISVIVTTPAGSNGANTDYEYVTAVAPTIDYLSPSLGSVDGGTPVSIYGSGFMNATSVTFDGVEVDSFTVVNDTLIETTSPPGENGPGTGLTVAVTTALGTGTTDTWEYTQGAPQVSFVDPGFGSNAGGESVTIYGLYFTGATSVTFEGSNASNVVVVDDNTITCDTPSYFSTGFVDVAVQTSYGSSTPNTAFEYV